MILRMQPNSMIKLVSTKIQSKFSLPKSFFCIVVGPFLLLVIFVGAIISSRYVSESKITVRNCDGGQDAGSLAISILKGGSSSSREDNEHLREYILSLDMLKYLDSSVGLRRAYQQGGDYFSRLLPWASQEDFLDYYRKHLEVTYDDASGILTIRTEAFDRDFSRRLNASIMYQCENFINANSHRIASDQLRFISGELTRAHEDMLTAKQKLLAFQNRNNVLDPVEQAKAMSAFVNQIDADMGRQETELRHLLSFLSDDAPQVVALRSKISSLRQQLNAERQKLSGSQPSKLNTMSSQFLLLQFQVEFAMDKYKATLAAYEKTRFEASRKAKTLLVISSPHNQQEAEYPRRVYIIFTSLAGLLVLFGLFRLLLATIKDHKD